MDYKKKQTLPSKSIIGLKRIPLSFKMKKYKETDINKHIIYIKGRKEKKSKTIQIFKINNENEKNKENQIQKNINDENQNQIQNLKIKLKRNKTIDPEIKITIDKKYEKIPIIAHNSEKPSKVIEEISAGKLFASIYTFNEGKKNIINKDIKNKEIKHNILKEKNSKCKIIKENNNNKKFDQIYEKIPIISHKSELPSISFEEIDGGKLISKIQTSKANHNKLIYKNKLKIKKYIEIPIIAHDSEKPSYTFEEINSGKTHCISHTLITDFNETKIVADNIKVDNKLKSKVNHLKNKKYKDIPIIVHESEKPSFIFEEIDSMNKNKIVQYSITNYNENNNNNKLVCKMKYKEIPIIEHNSEKPSVIFEEIDSINKNKFIQYSITNYKENSNNKIKLGCKKKYKEIPIIVHNSEKPSVIFEESNTGIPRSLNHKSILNF